MILHVDMDAFFASVEQRDHPELRGKPVVVGGSRHGRGVVAAASYEARKFGIHSAMSGRRAAELCPQAIFVKSNPRAYSEVGKQVREILVRFSPVIQPLSCDEAFLDVSGTMRHFGTVEELTALIKATIQTELNLTASIGAAPLKFIAKIASDLRKPDGCVIVTADQMQDFLDPLDIGRLWGVGVVANRQLQRFGIKTIGDLRQLETGTLRFLGNWGGHLHRLANCIDPREVVTDRSAKQISHERTFSIDITEVESLLAVANFLTDQVCRRLRFNDRRARTVSIKYRTTDFRTFNRSRSVRDAICQTDQVWPIVEELLTLMRTAAPQPVRLIGVSVGDLTVAGQPMQLNLFDQAERQNNTAIDTVTDKVAAKMGEYSIYRGTAHDWAKRKQQTDTPRIED